MKMTAAYSFTSGKTSTKARTKAMKLAVSVPGVESVSSGGIDKPTLIIVKGENFDSINLLKMLRKKVSSHADIVSLEPVEKPEKKKEEQEEPGKKKEEPEKEESKKDDKKKDDLAELIKAYPYDAYKPRYYNGESSRDSKSCVIC